MREDGGQQRRDVVGDDEAASVQGRPHLRGPDELQGGPGARAQPQIGMGAGRGCQGDRVLLDGRRDEIEEDFWRWTVICQLTNRVAYQGYLLVTRTGLRLSGWRFENGRDQRTNLVFLTINTGLR